MLGSVASASSSRLKLAGSGVVDVPLVVVNPKFCGSFGTASLTIVIEPSFLLVNVQLMSSEDSTTNVAVRVPTLTVLFGGVLLSIQAMLVRPQPATADSVIVYVPALTEHSMTFELLLKVKLAQPGRVLVKLKFVPSAGCASFRMLILAFLTL